ncbi:MAG: hypothetical protein A2418_02710 [Candidatus Brennerbacteria bacterium RIFOXYC1_FULL_41_11]|uniref:DUF4239 domain-containing protein n=1 Tax=Candidatus Brennerbacteria bacterium RIFOXYD1_FULL_41_16 TaxID=1797529 RepID=A0A1G1XJD2_9BACT|nr:MAG: hypothetical protein UU61_C0003G0013 [Parcubacteria group bacterium GW2011_GWB1_41_4]OGY38808.1 MAG: hypothetical protein A2391_02465 [Candidatus Brennerbacteria bacterium RIFOXYB1_FULL_41_13]OGY39090.1 MAG: hypothetical protein A2418_02710 [Candidatus Brennerbacteria bacterium RIFOXYC1_FULL_41_11]OGY40245.1 MAG: hypothetical protein A2570_03095 [Candidatus Brennerbacteria bacterium RIFOXYD1_FULL_41_16]
MKKLFLKFAFLELLLLTVAYSVRTYFGKEIFLADSANFGWVFGIIGTAYTLIAAFVLFGVWNQYSALSSLIARESWLLGSIWNFTDYFNDKKLTQNMKSVLLSYINQTVDKEVDLLAREQEVETYSKEYIAIGKVIDGIEFNDGRDAVIYPVMIQGYRDLLDVRQQRNEAGTTRLSFSMRILFMIFSLLLATSSLIAGFVYTIMYMFGAGFIGAVVILTYIVVADMDNPFGGLFELKPVSFFQTKKYIEGSSHQE